MKKYGWLGVLLLMSCSFDTYIYQDDIIESIGREFGTVYDLGEWLYESIASKSDWKLYRKIEYFASPKEILENMSGDCDDFATIYLYLLDIVFDERATIVIIHIKGQGGHVTVRDSYHDYLVSPKDHLWDLDDEEEYTILEEISFETWMSWATGNNTRQVGSR